LTNELNVKNPTPTQLSPFNVYMPSFLLSFLFPLSFNTAVQSVCFQVWSNHSNNPTPRCLRQARTGRGIHGRTKVSCGPAIPDTYTSCGRATPQTALRPAGRAACGRLLPPSIPHTVRAWFEVGSVFFGRSAVVCLGVWQGVAMNFLK
jgi:hypothetical protein